MLKLFNESWLFNFGVRKEFTEPSKNLSIKMYNLYITKWTGNRTEVYFLTTIRNFFENFFFHKFLSPHPSCLVCPYSLKSWRLKVELKIDYTSCCCQQDQNKCQKFNQITGQVRYCQKHKYWVSFKTYIIVISIYFITYSF